MTPVTDPPIDLSYHFVNGMRARWYNQQPPEAGSHNGDVAAGWHAMDQRIARSPQPADGIEASAWEMVAAAAWDHVLHVPYGSGVVTAFRLAQLADIMVEKLRGSEENEISFLEKLTLMSTLGIKFPHTRPTAQAPEA